MSITLYRDLVEYEGSQIYHDVLIKHIGYCQSSLNECQLLKRFDEKYVLTNHQLKDEMVILENQPDNPTTKQSAKRGIKTIDKLMQFFNTKKPTDQITPISRHTELTYRLEFLFSLNVCSDHLLLLIEQGKLTVEDYTQFFEAIGMTVLKNTYSYYNPFYHEIYYVNNKTEVGDNDEICVASQHYPAVMFGELMFVRAGVTIYNHPLIDKNLAEKSKIYFTNWRENRPCHDLSHGWGSNSSWRTSFVRNYDTKDYWRLNVDGELDLSDSEAYCKSNDYVEDNLPLSVATELLVNRHALTVNARNITNINDLFPYDWRLDTAKKDFTKCQ